MKKLIWFAPLVLLILTQFNNCSPYAQSDNSELSSLGDLVCDTDCITPTAANLAIMPVLFEGAQLRIPVNLGDFDIGGTCNEGGYPYNVITWQLYDANRNLVRDSSGANALSSCVNGRFRAYVKLSPIASDGADRTGLEKNGNPKDRQSYYLRFQIFGQLVQNGALQIGGTPPPDVTLIGI